MRIAYACYWNAYVADGVTAKIALQERHWRERGHSARVFCLTPRPTTGQESALAGDLFPFAGARQRIAATRELWQAITNYAPDLVYLRYDIFVPPPLSLFRRTPSVAELNTDDRREFRLRGPRVVAYNMLNRRLVLSGTDGLVCLTHELAARQAPLGKPTAVITNGVEAVGAVSGSRSARPTRIRAAFMARHAVPWQGLDKLARLARLLPDWDFELIGVDKESLPAEPPENVQVHGLLSRDEYGPLLARSDLGIGSLALHRKGMEEANALKVREYLAYGLPTVLAYLDSDFADGTPWFLLRLANTERNVEDELEAVRTFGERVRGRRVPWDEVAPAIGAAAKEEERLAFFTEVVGRSRKRSQPSTTSS